MIPAAPLHDTWTTAALGELVELAHGRALPEARRIAGEVPVYSSAGRIGEHLDPLHPGPSVVIGRKGNAGRVFYVPGPFWCIDTAFYVERLSPAVNAEFLALVLKGAQLERLSGGAAAPTLGRADLLRVQVPLPPAPEQERIVHLLHAATDLRLRAEGADGYAAEVAAALFQERFGDPATNPHRWPVVKLQALLDPERPVQSGPPAELLRADAAGDVPVWGLHNVGEGTFFPGPGTFVSASRFEAVLRPYGVRDGDVLVARAGTFGRMAVARFGNRPACLGSRLTRMSFLPDRVVPEYFVALVTWFGDRVGGLHSSTGRYGFTREPALSRVGIPLPPLEVQAGFRAELERLDGIVRRRHAIRAMLEELSAAMLASAATGELTAPWRASRGGELAEAAAVRDASLRSWLELRAGTLPVAAPIPETPPPPPHPRASLRALLGEQQLRLLEWIEAATGYVTAARLAERTAEMAERKLTVPLLRQGLDLLEQTGLVQRVSVARQGSGPAGGYVTAYRRLDSDGPEPRDHADDTLLLAERRA